MRLASTWASLLMLAGPMHAVRARGDDKAQVCDFLLTSKLRFTFHRFIS